MLRRMNLCLKPPRDRIDQLKMKVHRGKVACYTVRYVYFVLKLILVLNICQIGVGLAIYIRWIKSII